MPTIKTGLVDTQDILSNEKEVDMWNIINELQPDETQFYTMMTKLPSSPSI